MLENACFLLLKIDLICFPNTMKPHPIQRPTMASPRQIFGKSLLSKRSAIQYPADSPDLTFPDSYLWGCLIENVYSSNNLEF